MLQFYIRNITLLLSFTFLFSCGTSDSSSEEEIIIPGEYYIDIYSPSEAYPGTTLFTDSHDEENLKIVEVDMNGEIVWEYTVPQNIIRNPTVGFEAELISNGNILFVLSNSGIYEINRDGDIVWSHLDTNVSHDADRLQNGNTLYVFGNYDLKSDSQVKEITTDGNIVWEWKAVDYLNVPPYDTLSRQGWTHTNSVTRLSNGNTIISPRNFNITIEVNPQGNIIWQQDWIDLYDTGYIDGSDPHDPEIQTNNHLVVCLQWESPYQVVEIDRATNQPVWEYHRDNLRTPRDSDRLPNGNTLIVGVMEDTHDAVIFEVNQRKEIVWQLKIKDTPVVNSPGWFFKAQRISEN